MSPRFAEQKARDALAFDGPPESPWITISDSGFLIRVPYSPELSGLIRTFPGRKWDADKRQWTVPFTAADAIRNKLARFNTLAAAANAAAAEENVARAARRALRAVQRERRRHTHLAAPLQQEFLIPSDGCPVTALTMEAIGDNIAKGYAFAGFRERNWVAQILGMDSRGRWIRSYVSGNWDYAGANSVGSRGVMVTYMLAQGLIYEISQPQTWSTTDRYFVRIVDGEVQRLTDEDVEQCLIR